VAAVAGAAGDLVLVEVLHPLEPLVVDLGDHLHHLAGDLLVGIVVGRHVGDVVAMIALDVERLGLRPHDGLDLVPGGGLGQHLQVLHAVGEHRQRHHEPECDCPSIHAHPNLLISGEHTASAARD
jgi:hypothetical protein